MQLMLIGITTVPLLLIIVRSIVMQTEIGLSITIGFVFWLCTSFMPFLSYIITRELKSNISIAIMLVSTVVYGFLYILIWFLTFFVDGQYLFGFVLNGVFTMSPTFVLVLPFERRSTAPSSAPFE
jgi:hypothetical protein